MVSWLLLAIFRAARAAYTVVNWMLLVCAGGGEDTTELLIGGGSWVCRSVVRAPCSIGVAEYPEVGRLAVWVRLPRSAVHSASQSTRAVGSSRSRQQ